MQVAAGQRRAAAPAQALEEGQHVLGRQAFVPVVVHHHHRRAVARPQTLDLDDGEFAVGGGLTQLHAEGVAQGLGHALGTQQRTRERAADVQHALADRLGVEHRVVGHDVLDVRGAAADLLGHVPHRGAGEVALLPLRQVERVENRRLALILRVTGDVLVELLLVLGRVGERRAVVGQRALGPVEPGRRVLHLGMKAHRSQSPMTTSVEPMTATTSAIRPPWTTVGSAWIAMSDGARIFTRHGRFVPSDTT